MDLANMQRNIQKCKTENIAIVGFNSLLFPSNVEF